jgi:hypothetical protein
MNILEIEDVIKGLPDQALMQEAQAPSGQMPQFLVVSEIQRRADMRKRFQNQQQEMPQGTIAQQIVQGGIASMGNQQPIQPMPQQGMPQGMPPQGMPPMPPQGMPQGMPPQGMPQQGMPMQQQPPMMPPMSPPMSPPMMPPAQGMAGGGVVRMQAGTQIPYTGGTQIDPGYDEFMRQQTQDYLLNQGVIRESMPRPEPNMLDRFLQKSQEFMPNYSLIAPSRAEGDIIPSGFGEGVYDSLRAESSKILDALKRGLTPIGQREGTSIPQITSQTTPAITPAVSELITQTASPSIGGNATQIDGERIDPIVSAPIIGLALNAKTPKDKVAEDTMKSPQGSDYSSLQAVIDEFKPVDYSAFKPDYLNLITEQERRAQKIRDDASKDASAQALIQLGAGLAAGDISKGLSAAGQSVADIKRQARSEARDEEGFARQLRLAQDEAGMQLGVKGAEAEREMARFKATYGVSLKELENTMTLARERIEAEENTEAGRMLRGRLEGLNNLIKNLVSDPFAGDMEQNKAAIAQAVAEMKSLLGITDEKQNEKKDTDAIEAAKSLLGIQ